MVATAAPVDAALSQQIATFAQECPDFLATKELGPSKLERFRNFVEQWKEKRAPQTVQTGAHDMSVQEYFANEQMAIQRYEAIRQDATDIKEIAKNAGMPEFKIQRIKEHVFYDDTHILSTGVERFFPSKPIAESWERLKVGNFTPNDIKLLEHEYWESKFEKIFRTGYDTAHAAAGNKKINKGWKPPVG